MPPLVFPPFTGHGPCPKCGNALLTFWHEWAMSDWELPPMVEHRACYEVAGWPSDEGGPLDPENKGEEEHLHRVCEACGYQAVEALATPEQRNRPMTRYDLVYGLKTINERAAKGWRVVNAMMPGTDVVALMEAP